MERHLYEDEFVMLYEDGSRMLLDTVGGSWVEQPTAAESQWIEQAEPGA